MKKILFTWCIVLLLAATSYAAITEATPRAEYTAAGGDTYQCADTGGASQGWPIWVKEDLRVWLDGTLQVVDTDYTVTFTAGDDSNCSITFVSTPTSGLSVVMERASDQEKASDFATSGPFSMASLNSQVDYLTTLAQDNKARIDRTARLDPGVEISTSFSRLPQPEAGKVLGYETDGSYKNLAYSFEGTWSGENAADYTGLKAFTAQADEDQSFVAGRSTPLDHGGGVFVWDSSDRSTEVTADAQEGIYVAPNSDATGASGAWIRQHNGVVTVEMFGAVGDGVTINTTAIQAALDSGVAIVEVNDGNFLSGPLDMADTVTRFTGGGTLTAGGTIADFSNFIECNTISDVTIDISTINVSVSTYPTVVTIALLTSTNIVVENIKFTGGGLRAVWMSACLDCTFRHSVVGTYAERAAFIETGDNCVIDDITTQSSGAADAIRADGGKNHTVSNCDIDGAAINFFGITFFDVQRGFIRGNTLINTSVEAITLGGNSRFITVDDNNMQWDAGQGQDFGMSMQGTDASNIVADCTLSNNVIIGASKNGIEIASDSHRNIITDNKIINCARDGAGFDAGIGLDGTNVEENRIINNHIANTTAGPMVFGVKEIINVGTPNNTIITGNTSEGLTTEVSILGANSRQSGNMAELDVPSFASTVAATAGTITTAAGGIDYQISGRMITATIIITITTNGTGSGAVTATLPVNANLGVMSGRATVSGDALIGYCVAGVITITDYAGVYPGADGETLTLSGVYREQ